MNLSNASFNATTNVLSAIPLDGGMTTMLFMFAYSIAACPQPPTCALLLSAPIEELGTTYASLTPDNDEPVVFPNA